MISRKSSDALGLLDTIKEETKRNSITTSPGRSGVRCRRSQTQASRQKSEAGPAVAGPRGGGAIGRKF